MSTTRASRARRTVTAGFIVAMFLVALDTTAVNVALVTIARGLHATPRATGAIAIAYMTGAAVLMPVGGAIADRLGHRRTAAAAVSVFTICSAGCAVAADLPLLTALRAAQGAGAGVLIPVVAGAFMGAYPPAGRARAARVSMIGWVSAPALGPLFGGWCSTDLSWRWIFVANVPLGLALGVLVWRVGDEADAAAAAGVRDVTGGLLCVVGFGLLFYALGEGAASGWSAVGGTVAAVALAIGAIALGGLVAVELHRREPVLRLRLLAEPEFGLANAVSLFALAAFAGMLYVVPLLVQDIQHRSPLVAGSSVLVEAIGVQATAQTAEGLCRRIGTFRTIAIGLAGTAAAFGALAAVGVSDGIWALRACVLAIGGFMGLVFMPLQAAGFDRIARADLAHATAIVTTQRQLAGALGVALAAVALYSGASATTVVRCRIVFLAAAGVAVLAGLLASLAARVPLPAVGDQRKQPADILGRL